MTSSIIKKTADYKAKEAARVIEQAPLFCWNGIKDATGKKLQPAYYSEGAVTDSEKAIFIHATGGTSFSPQVLNCFKALETNYLMRGFSKCDRIHVHEGAVTDSEKAIFIHATGGTSFSPQVLNCFKALETNYLMRGFSKCDRIHVHPFHPLYSQVKAAAKANVMQEEKQPTTQAAESMGVAA
ncbi:hypothetical protein [Xylella fastidiosa]|uniref:hypothetical protein n=1 Tax=Xylella fastidiosa TaxID=2371 RepID=UPI0034E01E76